MWELDPPSHWANVAVQKSQNSRKYTEQGPTMVLTDDFLLALDGDPD